MTVNKITDAAQQHNVGLWEIISNLDKYELQINAGTKKRISGFQSLIADFIEQSKEQSAFEVAKEVIKKTGIAQESFSDLSPEGMSRTQNIQELLNAMNEFVEMRLEQGEEDTQLIDFLSEAALLTDQDTDKESGDDKITLMTVHASKGLEFEHVFIVGMEEDLFPSSMAKSEIRGLEEERRLFYVALTRAKQTCVITFAKSRFRHGQTEPARQSQFLNDIDAKFIQTETTSLKSPKEGVTDGFWESMRRGAQSTRTPLKKAEQSFTRKTPVSQTSSMNTLSKEANALQEGQTIEHERFGTGTVISIENNGNDRRAFVEFETVGKKQLLLKFAKFTIVKD